MDNSSLFREKYSFEFAKVKVVYITPNEKIELWSRVDKSMRHKTVDKNEYIFKNILFKSVFLKIAIQSSWNAHENLNIASLPFSIKIVNYKTNLFNQHSKWYPKSLKFKLKFGFTSMWLAKLSSLELSPLKTRNIHLYQTFIMPESRPDPNQPHD